MMFKISHISEKHKVESSKKRSIIPDLGGETYSSNS